MTDYITDQCQLNMELIHIIYVLSLNVIFIFMPAVALVIFYILIIIKLEKHNKLMKERQLQYMNKFVTSQGLLKKNEQISNNKSGMNSQEQNEILNTMGDYKAKMRLILITYLKAFLFFSLHLPIKIFIFWSYINFYIYPVDLNEIDQNNDSKIQLTNLLSNIATLIYFLHCISNPIIYNFSSTRFLNVLIK
jgi:preprotein translocase subunit YajC